MGGDDIDSGSASQAATRQQTTQDLLADIFGTSNDEVVSPSAPAPSGQSSVNEIMGLFDSTSISSSTPSYSAPPPSNPSVSNDFFSSLSSTAPAPSPAPKPAPPVKSAPTPFDAYNSNGLTITLTPVRDASNPLVVNILARFTSSVEVTGVNFQAAVPKVSIADPRIVEMENDLLTLFA